MGFMKRRDLEKRIEELERVQTRLLGRINKLEAERKDPHYHVLTDAELECVTAVFGGTD